MNEKSVISEKTLERKLAAAVKQRGGLCLKLWGLSIAGFPDRIILLPGGRVYFIELKSTGKKPSPLQQSRIKLLRKLGFYATVISDNDMYLQFINKIDYGV